MGIKNIKLDKNNPPKSDSIYRIIDANCNRLREALRVMEEYFRFITCNEVLTIKLKKMRHAVKNIETAFDPTLLLAERDTKTDPFSDKVRPEEYVRETLLSLFVANVKRGQEASRVLEEYLKLSSKPNLSENAKIMRFSLYALEKDILGE